MGALGGQRLAGGLHRGPAGLLRLPADHVEAVVGCGPPLVAAVLRLLRDRRWRGLLSVQSEFRKRLRD